MPRSGPESGCIDNILAGCKKRSRTDSDENLGYNKELSESMQNSEEEELVYPHVNEDSIILWVDVMLFQGKEVKGIPSSTLNHCTPGDAAGGNFGMKNLIKSEEDWIKSVETKESCPSIISKTQCRCQSVCHSRLVNALKEKHLALDKVTVSRLMMYPPQELTALELLPVNLRRLTDSGVDDFNRILSDFMVGYFHTFCKAPNKTLNHRGQLRNVKGSCFAGLPPLCADAQCAILFGEEHMKSFFVASRLVFYRPIRAVPDAVGDGLSSFPDRMKVREPMSMALNCYCHCIENCDIKTLRGKGRVDSTAVVQVNKDLFHKTLLTTHGVWQIGELSATASQEEKNECRISRTLGARLLNDLTAVFQGMLVTRIVFCVHNSCLLKNGIVMRCKGSRVEWHTGQLQFVHPCDAIAVGVNKDFLEAVTASFVQQHGLNGQIDLPLCKGSTILRHRASDPESPDGTSDLIGANNNVLINAFTRELVKVLHMGDLLDNMKAVAIAAAFLHVSVKIRGDPRIGNNDPSTNVEDLHGCDLRRDLTCSTPCQCVGLEELTSLRETGVDVVLVLIPFKDNGVFVKLHKNPPTSGTSVSDGVNIYCPAGSALVFPATIYVTMGHTSSMDGSSCLLLRLHCNATNKIPRVGIPRMDFLTHRVGQEGSDDDLLTSREVLLQDDSRKERTEEEKTQDAFFASAIDLQLARMLFY